ncbi:MAG: PaaI family thioesterase [Actinomycetota bacterium]|nr:PaaI family thioesterase [Actinomycetota bacterium]
MSERAVLLDVSPFDRHYGLEVVERGDELVRGRVAVQQHVTQPVGMVHGGVYASIAEGLASLGTNHGVAEDGEIALGMSNQSTFLRPVTQGSLHATARRRHRGRTTWVWDVEVADDEGRVCALSRVTVAIRSARGSEERDRLPNAGGSAPRE